MQIQPQFQVFTYDFNLAKDKVDKDKVDKGSNRKTPNTAGGGPRPPKKNEYPDQDDKSENKSKENKEKN